MLRQPRQPTHAEIAALARSLWEKSGRTEGHAIEDWLTAEKILEGEFDKEVP